MYNTIDTFKSAREMVVSAVFTRVSMSNTIDTSFKAARNLVVGAVATTGVALGTPQPQMPITL
jgi:hypothetical protein